MVIGHLLSAFQIDPTFFFHLATVGINLVYGIWSTRLTASHTQTHCLMAAQEKPKPQCPEKLSTPQEFQALIRHLVAFANHQEGYVYELRNDNISYHDGGVLVPVEDSTRMNFMNRAVASARLPDGKDFWLVKDPVNNRLWLDLSKRIRGRRVAFPRVDSVIDRFRSYKLPTEPITLPLKPGLDDFSRRILETLLTRWIWELALRSDGVVCPWMHESLILLGYRGLGKSSLAYTLLGGEKGDHKKLKSQFHANSRFDTCADAHALSWEMPELTLMKGTDSDNVADLMTLDCFTSRDSIRWGGGPISRLRLFAFFGTTNKRRCLPPDCPAFGRRCLPAELDYVDVPRFKFREWIQARREGIIAQAMHHLDQWLEDGNDPADLVPTFSAEEGWDAHLAQYLRTDGAEVRTWSQVLDERPTLAASAISLSDAKALMGIKADKDASVAMDADGWARGPRVTQPDGSRPRLWVGPDHHNEATVEPAALVPAPSTSDWFDGEEHRAAFFDWVTLNKTPVTVKITSKAPDYRYFVVGHMDPSVPSQREGAPKDDDITGLSSLFWEWDDRPIEDQLTYDYPHELLLPTVQLLTGHKSVHNYLALNFVIAPDRANRFLKALVQVLGSDVKIVNPGRVLRLPGVAHEKTGVLSAWREMGRQPLAEQQFCQLETWLLKQVSNPAQQPRPVAPRSPLKPRDAKEGLIARLSYIPPSPEAGQGTYGDYSKLGFSIGAYCDEHGLSREFGAQAIRDHSPLRADLLAKCVMDADGSVTSATLGQMAIKGGWKP